MNKKLLVVSMAAVFSAQMSASLMAASEDGNAVATVIEPLSITENTAIDFGTVSGGPAAGTVVITTAGARSVTGDAQIIGTDGAAGTFTISGQGGQAYTLTFSGVATLENAGGDQMTADTFTDDSAGTIPGTGASTEDFNVGATLNLDPSQPSGSYSTATGGGSEYTITVNYD